MAQIRKPGARKGRSFAIVWLFAIILAIVATPDRAQPDNLRRFDLRIENGRLSESREVIAVHRDDRVEINWRADRRTALHLHGYDIELTVGPDKPETMTFVARATGRFAIETHTPPSDEKAGLAEHQRIGR